MKRHDSYVADLIEILRPHKNGLSRRLVVTEVKRRRQSKKLPTPDAFEEAVQSAFNQHCSQSAVFKNPEDELFSSKHDGGTAVWTVNAQRADVWLRIGPSLYELAQAMARAKGVSTEKVVPVVEAATDAQRKQWRNHAVVKEAIPFAWRRHVPHSKERGSRLRYPSSLRMISRGVNGVGFT